MEEVTALGTIQVSGPLLSEVFGRRSRVKHESIVLWISDELDVDLVDLDGVVLAVPLPAHLVVIKIQGY